ncbi:MAG TPA: polysaccharide biosynthesis C-terminal domain-containing protein [Solirubrobacteraceae bacterium]|nr:polysaccharide biosynthesis C-terminal domain-containing protein [Solirubrobacteraceae bacterium]
MRAKPRSAAPPARGSLSAGLSFGAASFLTTTVATLFTSVFIARLYGVVVVGQFALVYAPVAAAALLSTVREQPALQRAIALLPPRHTYATALFYAVFAFSSGLTLAIALLGAGAVYLLFHGPIHHPGLVAPALVNLAGYTVFTNTCMNLDSVFIAFRDGRRLFVLRLHQALLYLALIFAGRLVSGSVWSLVATMILSWALPCVHRLVEVRRWLVLRVPRAEARAGLRALPEMLRFGLRLTPAGLLWGVCDQSATWVLGSVAPVATVGAYSRAWSLGQRFLEARLRLSELLFPTLVERRQTGDQAGFDRAVIDSLRYGSAFLLLFAAVGGGAAKGIMAVFGPRFVPAATALAFLLLVPAFTTMVFLVSQALIASDRALRLTASAAVRLVVTLPAVVVLTERYGITGAGVGMALGAAAQLACQLLVVQRELIGLVARWWSPRQVAGQVAAYAGAFAAARMTLRGLHGYGGLLAALVLGTVVYLALLAAVGGLSGRDRERARRLRARLAAARQQPSASAPFTPPRTQPPDRGLVLARAQRAPSTDDRDR